MANSGISWNRTHRSLQDRVLNNLIDDALTCYLDWRDYADLVSEAYREWSSSPEQEALHYAVYVTALDHEAAAAAAYSDSLQIVERYLPSRQITTTDPHSPGRRPEAR